MKYFIGRHHEGEEYRIRLTKKYSLLDDTIWEGDDYIQAFNFLKNIIRKKRIEENEKQKQQIIDKKHEEALKFNEKWDLICGL